MRLKKIAALWFFAALFGAVLFGPFAPGQTWAAGKTYPGLTDGMEILSAYSSAHPRAKKAFDKILERAPAEVQEQVRSSGWAERQRNMTPKDLYDAAGDKNLTLLPTADGLAVIPPKKLNDGINALTDFAIDQKETAALLDVIKDHVPDDMKSKVNKLSEQLKDLRKAQEKGDKGLWRQAKRIAIKGTVSGLGKIAINIVSSRIRAAVNEGSARKTLEDYKKKAAGLREKARKTIPAAEAELQRRQAEAAKQTREKAEAEALENVKDKATKALGDVSRQIARNQATIAQCEKVTALITPAPVPGGVPALQAMQKQMDQLDDALRTADASSSWDNLTELIGDAENEAGRACSDPAAYTAANSKDALSDTLIIARGVRSGIQSQLDTAIAALRQPPINTDVLRNAGSDLKTKRDNCLKHPSAADKNAGQLKLSENDKKAWERLWGTEAVLKGMGSPLDVSALGLRAEFARLLGKAKSLKARSDRCLAALRAAERNCQKMDKAIAANDNRISRIDAMNARRATALQTLTSLLDKINEDFSRARNAVVRGQGCISEGDNKQDSCNRNKIKEAYAEANAAYQKESYATARRKVHEILAKYGGCPGVTDRVTKDDGLIDNMVGGGINVGTAIDDCDVPRLNRQVRILNNSIAKIDRNPNSRLPRTRRILQRWIARIEAAMDKCTKVASANPAGGGGSGGGAGSPGGGAGSGMTQPPGGAGSGGSGSTGGGATPTCPTTQQAGTATTKTFNMMVGTPGGGAAAQANPDCGGDCQFIPGWFVPANARCGVSNQPMAPTGGAPAGPRTASGGTAGGPMMPTPRSGGGRASNGCSTGKICPDKCRDVAWSCSNGEWMGGHCVCDKSVFGK